MGSGVGSAEPVGEVSGPFETTGGKEGAGKILSHHQLAQDRVDQTLTFGIGSAGKSQGNRPEAQLEEPVSA